jgi:hypothetical protein
MTFAFNQAYRESEEYKDWVTQIKRDFPKMSLYQIESAIIMHKTDPQHYKKAKDAKQVFNTAPKVRVNDKPAIIEDAVKISDAPVEEPKLVIEDVTV